MALWSKASQGHEGRHDPEAMVCFTVPWGFENPYMVGIYVFDIQIR